MSSSTVDPSPPENPIARLPPAFSLFLLLFPLAGLMAGSSARLSLVICSGAKHSLLATDQCAAGGRGGGAHLQ